MRTAIFLFTALFCGSLSQVQSQTVLFSEDFDGSTISVINSSVGGNPPSAIKQWTDTTGIFTSSNKSYYVKGTQTQTDVMFETPPFDTRGNPYVRLQFNQIAKLFSANQAYLQISTDGGTTWQFIDVNNAVYSGGDPSFPSLGYFNQGSHQRTGLSPWRATQPLAQPDNSWWIQETFDLTGLASEDTSGSAGLGHFRGYPDVRLRWRATFNFRIIGSNPPSFSAGWFVDDIEVVGGPCELSPPQVTYNFNPIPCYQTDPQGGLVHDPLNNFYPIGVEVADTASPYDTGIDSVVATYRINRFNTPGKGPWQDTVMVQPSSGSSYEYKVDIPNVFLLDTVDYYVTAYDKSCPSPNATRRPDVFTSGGFYTFWIDSGLPAKCGSPFCGAQARVIHIDSSWIENFEGTEWGAGSGDGNSGTSHRGNFPDVNQYRWTVAPGANNNSYGWSIRSGTTGTNFTGPDGDHSFPSGGGKYLYVESSHFTGGPSVTTLTSPCIDLSKANTCHTFEFYYHMFGQDIDLVRVDIDTGSDGAAWWNNFYVERDQQQFSSSDPWKRALFSLEPFIGQLIRVRFIAINRNYNGLNTTNDIAIDDIRIFQTDPYDVEVLGTNFPEEGYCSYSANEPVTISLRNNGCAVLQDIPIAFQVNNNPPTWDTIKNINLGRGQDTIDHVFVPGADLSAFQQHQVKVWVDIPNDIDRDNDTAIGPVIDHHQSVTNFPYIENFENGVPFTQNLNNTHLIPEPGLSPDLKWQVGNSLTPTPGTGPYSGFYWQGNYLYVESDGTSGNISTFLRTKCFDFAGMTKPTLDFLFHGYASDFSNLVIEVSLDGEDIDTWNPIQGSSVSASMNNEFSDWQLKRVDLSAYAGQAIKLRFRANRKSAAGDKTNFAIDNIVIYDRLTQDAGAISLNQPAKRGIPNPNLNPQVTVANYGDTPLNNLTINLDITPLCGSNQQTQSYTETVTGPAPGNTQTYTWPAGQVTWPLGESRVCVYTTVAGDTYNFNDTICRNVITHREYDIPFATTFDSCDYSEDGFFPGGPGFLQWELGTPTFGFGPYSSPNTWATNLDGPFVVGTEERLVVPILKNFDTIARPTIRFYQSYNFGGGGTGNYNAAGTIMYNASGGFEVLGGSRVGLGGSAGGSQIGIWWLDGPGADLRVNLFNDKPGWVGSTGGQYQFTEYVMNELGLKPAPFQLLLRFEFESDPSGNPAAGWAIDDFEIHVPPQNSVGPIDVYTADPLPFPNQDHTLVVRVRNTGAKVVDEYKMEIKVNGTSLNPGGPQLVNVPNQGTNQFSFNRTREDTFAFPWPANLTTPGAHEVCVTTSRPNDKQDNYPADDDSCFTVIIMREIDMTATGDSSFCDDFEGTNENWITRNSLDLFSRRSSWEMGVPTQIDTGAYQGQQVWMTNLDDDYESMDASGLYSPKFLLDSGQTYHFEFWHWFRTEQYHDGGNLEYSFDNGQDWQPIGYVPRDKHRAEKSWYNTAFVSALDKIRGGWTDSSNSWIKADQKIAFKDDVEVVFRFRFGADFSIEEAGWAIDDFCFSKSGDQPDVVIGDEDYALPPETIIGELAPNPAQSFSELTFHIPQPTEFNVTVYNVVGQEITSFSERYDSGVHQMSFNTENWKNGVYLVNLEYRGQTVTRKLLVSH